ncbi:hypothetical protein [Kordiimonas aquimaris]|uniref:hypothetical protein n=1 Tax=Kordiimonas aquimaris TaxID=707591 RepID=UPI0021CE6022|nr:hypothetical protein [Kordiimonas aquimaris]
MNIFLMSAAAICTATTFIHCYLGGKTIAAPLLRANDINDVAKYTNYYCWHLVSATLAMMSAAFLWAAVNPSAFEAAIIAEILAIIFLVWNIGLIIWKGQSFTGMPQWILFGVISVTGGIGLFS